MPIGHDGDADRGIGMKRQTRIDDAVPAAVASRDRSPKLRLGDGEITGIDVYGAELAWSAGGGQIHFLNSAIDPIDVQIVEILVGTQIDGRSSAADAYSKIGDGS